MTISIAEVFPGLLTPRQREVCAFLVRGYTSKQAAEVLGISPRTVEDHRDAILKAVKADRVTEVTLMLCGSPEIVA